MKFGAIVNTAAGSVPDDGISLLKEAVAEFGHEVMFPPEEDWPPEVQIRQMVREKLDAVIVWGGMARLRRFCLNSAVIPCPYWPCQVAR